MLKRGTQARCSSAVLKRLAELAELAEASHLIMLEGPSGCGKTAAVHACAAELGFKVIEVNPAMVRAGKQVPSGFTC